MECLDGLDLSDLLRRDGTPGLPAQRAIHFVVQVLRGLQAAHAVGIIHRDMKPSNCFVVNNDGEEDFVKILDFGISKVAQPGSASLTQTNSALGTPLYMSPEQAKSPRDVDGRSDLYSVGVILYELLTGNTPFNSESGEFTEILFKLFTADAPPVKDIRPDLPDALAAVVHKALAREVADRYSTPLEMAEALEPFAGEHTRPVVAKMRGFKPPQKGSLAPPEHLAPSMAAFSQLKKGAGTDVMPDRPRITPPKVPAFTEVMPNAPARVIASPTSNETRARPEEAAARTQFDSFHEERFGSGRPDAPAGASTDLGAAVPATTPSGAPPKRSPMVFAIVGGAAVVLGLGGYVVATRGGDKTAGASSGGVVATSSTTANVTPPPPTHDPAPSATATASTEPAATATASASASASSSAPPKTSPHPPPHKPPPKPANPNEPGLDTNFQK
jgi:serine/threonine-protein kinase